MRVIHVAPTVFGSSGLFGGGERYPVELARALARRVDTELVTFGRTPSERREDGLRVRVLRPLTLLGGHPGRPLAPSLPAALRGADVVHTHHMRSPASIVAALAARLRGASTAVTDHGLQGREWAGLVPRLFDRFLLVSRYSAAELRSPRRRTRIVYGGADPERYRPDGSVSRSGVLFVGRLTPHKGVDRLIEALPDGADLLIAGSEGHDDALPERGYPALLRRLSSGRRVRFLGVVADRDLPDLYRGAAVLALPSVQRTCYGRTIAVSELLGLVALEAMASGTPVVASRLGGLAEIVEDGVTGYLVEPGDEDALRERLAELLADRAKADRMGRSGRERVLAGFTWDQCAERCLAAYQEVVAGDRADR